MNIGPARSATESRLLATRVCIWRSLPATTCMEDAVGGLDRWIGNALPDTRLLQGNVGQCENRSQRPRGREHGAIRDSARPRGGPTGERDLQERSSPSMWSPGGLHGGSRVLWRDTDSGGIPVLLRLLPGQVAVFATGTLGYEWNEAPNEGAPPGLMRLSSRQSATSRESRITETISPPGQQATHSLTLYRHSSGALVFSAGTVQWSWGLDDMHDGTGGSSSASLIGSGATADLAGTSSPTSSSKSGTIKTSSTPRGGQSRQRKQPGPRTAYDDRFGSGDFRSKLPIERRGYPNSASYGKPARRHGSSTGSVCRLGLSPQRNQPTQHRRLRRFNLRRLAQLFRRVARSSSQAPRLIWVAAGSGALRFPRTAELRGNQRHGRAN